MKAVRINTTQKVTPMIYAYTTPEIQRHNGWTKIGYTEKKVEDRIREQTHTADVAWNLEWKGNALFDDGSYERFTDKDFHAYLRKQGVEQEQGKNNEWFHITGSESRTRFYDFKSDHGILSALNTTVPYNLRKEQEKAVNAAAAYSESTENGEFLLNAKPRFGKTLSVYDLCKKINAERVLIVTNRPAIANSWYFDYVHFLGDESGYKFVSSTDSLKGKPYVISRDEFIDLCMNDDTEYKKIEFVSLQDMKGSVYFGGQYDKLSEVSGTEWDILVIDEAHEGVDTYKTDVAFDHIRRKFTLHLSGTPFKALANDKFGADAIFNWTYADEQEAKRNWADENPDEDNPYGTLPQLNLLTYQMSEIIKDEIKQGVEINGETEEYAFDLNEFFETNNGKFVHNESVNKFLYALATQTKFPFSTEELRQELKHTFWLLNRVDSAKALADKLKNHPVFGQYEIILAAGDGKLDDHEATQKSFDKVTAAIKEHDKTITLSVGQLTTGITIPEWTAVLMLSNIKSPALYMQAAFRAQNPCLFNENGVFRRKENAYVFDFDPARTLIIYEQFANDLSKNTANGNGDSNTRKENVKNLLNFFPVLGEDDEGEMVELDAEKVLSIPRKIKSQEVVRRGFMSDFLFQNIANVFHAPKEVIDIISSFVPVEEPKAQQKSIPVTPDTADELSIDKNGEVSLDEGYVIGKTADVFGSKIYESISIDVTEKVEQAVEMVRKTPSESSDNAFVERLKKDIMEKTVAPILSTVKSSYGSDIKRSDEKEIERRLGSESDVLVNKAVANFNIAKNTTEQERQKALEQRAETQKSLEEINREFDAIQEENAQKFQAELTETITEFIENASQQAVETAETKIKSREKDTVEDSIRDHLRGFSRTIPSFLMAYGDDSVTIENFDKVIPDHVFKEVTSITLEQFRFLRDGGDYTDEETGELRHFNGNLFEPTVFNDSVKEFLRLKAALADYFDESSTEDIFDYIPPQKTNQIFTPKNVVIKMVDLLEEENPGCFNDPDKTFIDLYMKSGLYIAEIVKRLYRSEAMKTAFIDDTERLKHIFEYQVYGLAPTEIIFKIATNFILGFDFENKITKNNFRQVDALIYAKEGTLSEKLDEVFG